MDQIKVLKKDLLKVLRENKATHRTNFETALDGWYKTCVIELERLLAEAKAGKQKQVILNLPRPEDHTAEYDRHIQMLEMDIEDTVELDIQEFSQFVQDDWGWKRQWTTSNSSYMAASKGSK